jgi:hypothetical protein
MQGVVRIKSMPAQAMSGSSYARQTPHQKMQKMNKMNKMNKMKLMQRKLGEEHEEEGVSALSAREVVFLPSPPSDPQEAQGMLGRGAYFHKQGALLPADGWRGAALRRPRQTALRRSH